MATGMGLLSWIAVGLIAGVLARWLMPGDRTAGCLATVGVGIVGAIIGGFLAAQIGIGEISGLNLPSLLTACGGAVLFLLLLRAVSGRTS